MEGAELANYLRNLRAAAVATIEVMTTPPAKYAAEGDAGIINIVERKRLTDYFGGTVSDNHYSSIGQTNDAALSLKYKGGALSLYANATLGAGHPYHRLYYPANLCEPGMENRDPAA